MCKYPKHTINMFDIVNRAQNPNNPIKAWGKKMCRKCLE